MGVGGIIYFRIGHVNDDDVAMLLATLRAIGDIESLEIHTPFHHNLQPKHQSPLATPSKQCERRC